MKHIIEMTQTEHEEFVRMIEQASSGTSLVPLYTTLDLVSVITAALEYLDIDIQFGE